MVYYVVDRFENTFAVCEDPNGKRIHIERNLLPHGVKESSVIRLVNGAYQLDEELEKTLRRINWELQKQVFGNE